MPVMSTYRVPRPALKSNRTSRRSSGFVVAPMVEVTCNSRKLTEEKLTKVSRTLAETVSLSGMRGEDSGISGFDEGLVVVLFSSTRLSESMEVTLVRSRIEWMLGGRDHKIQEEDSPFLCVGRCGIKEI